MGDDVSRVAKAVKETSGAVKINYAIYGNLCPHVHCHIFPQQQENDPHAPILSDKNVVQLPNAEYHVIIEAIRERLTGAG